VETRAFEASGAKAVAEATRAVKQRATFIVIVLNAKYVIDPVYLLIE
jgi:3-oxoacyl-(acyl-carrier-protein) synthase